MRVILRKYINGDTYDITQSVGSKIKWSGSKSSAPRSLEISYIKKHFDVEISTGDRVYLFSDEEEEIFRGIFFKGGTNVDLVQKLTAYDAGYYLVKNKESIVVTNKTASEVFKSICGRFGISTGKIANTKHIIESSIYKKSKIYDIMLDLLSITYHNTGKRYYIRDNKGKLELIKRRDNVLQLVIEPESNLSRMQITEDATKIYNRIKTESDSKRGNRHFSISDVKQDSKSIDRFGVLQYYKKVNLKTNESDIIRLSKTLLSEKNKVDRNIRLNQVLGEVDCISGNAIFLSIPKLKISKSFYIQRDNHTFDNGSHIMDLELLESGEL